MPRRTSWAWSLAKVLYVYQIEPRLSIIGCRQPKDKSDQLSLVCGSIKSNGRLLSKGARVKETASTRKGYFAERSALTAFDKALLNHVRTVIKLLNSQFVSPENHQRLRHGDSWSLQGNPKAVSTGIQQHSTELYVKFEHIIEHDLGAIDRYVEQIVKGMHEQFMQMMYSTVSAACDQSGNVVDAKEAGGPLEGFAAMLEKIQFSADKYGKVTLPQVHLHPDTFKRMQDAQKTASPELLRRIEETKARKTAEALHVESLRKARFVKYGEEA